MLQVGRGLDLGQEPVGPDQRRQLRTEHLDCHLAIVPEVIGQVHGRHATVPQLPLDPVAVGEGGGEGVEGVHVQAVDGRWSVVPCRLRICRSAAEAATLLVSLK